MVQTLPPLNWFRAFETAARHLSFTAAAEEIGLTQSAISQQIKLLEMRLGVPLFDRKPRGLALTDHGRRLLPPVEVALETLSAAAGSFFSDKPVKLLTVSVSISVLQWVISPRLHDFTAENPDIAFRFISAIWPDEFTRTVADVEIRFGSKKQAGPQAVMLGTSQLAALKPKTMTGPIQHLPLIETVGVSGGWPAWGVRVGVDRLCPSIYVDSYGAALELAVRGSGVCLVNELLAREPLQQGIIEIADPARIDANEGYYLSINNDTSDAQIFADWITTIAA